MILTTDVAYSETSAVAAGILHRDWASEMAERTIVEHIGAVAPYEPGAFYKRELPCLMRLLAAVDHRLDAIVVDGYVTLGPDQAPGLGWHLHDAIDRVTPVVGIAKSEFAGTPEACRVYRGGSSQPLFVTAIGMPLSAARAKVVGMHGPHRLPTLLRQVDRVCRDALASGPGTPGKPL